MEKTMRVGQKRPPLPLKRKESTFSFLVSARRKALLYLDGQGGYLKDNTGTEVMSSLNENMCKQIAEAGGGGYIHVDNTNVAQEKLNAALAKLQKGEIDSVIYSEFDEQFRAVAIIVLILLIIEVCIMESRNPLLKDVKLFKSRNKVKENLQ